METGGPQQRPWLSWAWALAVGLPLFALTLAPTMGSWRQGYIGSDHVDTWGTQWFYWLLGRRVLEGIDFAHTDLLFHPWGKDVYVHTGGNVLDAAVALPFRFLLGPELGYNVFIVAILLANGLAMYLLARELGAPARASAAAAALFAFNPYVLLELEEGRPTQAILLFVCLFWMDWSRLSRAPGWGQAARAGLWLGLAGLCYWFYALFCVLAALLSAPLLLWRSEHRGATFARMAVAGAVSAAIALPLALPMLTAMGTGEVPGLFDIARWTEGRWAPVTMEGWQVGLELFDPWTRRVGFAYLLDRDIGFEAGGRALWLGPALLGAVGLLGLGRGRATARPILWASLGVGLVLALGPALGGSGTANALYVELISMVAVLRRLWWPARALVLVHVALGAGLALALGRLEAWAPVQLLAVGLVVGAAAWELREEGPAPLSTVSSEVPAVYHCLREAEEGALLELPFGDSPVRLHYQAIHLKPLFGGMVEDNPIFTPQEQIDWRQRNRWLLGLLGVSDGDELRPLDPDQAREGSEAVAALGYRFVLVDYTRIRARQLENGDRLGGQRQERATRVHLRELLGETVYDDGDYAVFMPWGGTLSCEAAPGG